MMVDDDDDNGEDNKGKQMTTLCVLCVCRDIHSATGKLRRAVLQFTPIRSVSWSPAHSEGKSGSLHKGCCHVQQVTQGASKLPQHHSLHWPELTAETVASWACLQ